MPSASQWTAGFCLLLALAAWAWALMADISIAEPGKARIKADPVQGLEASLPTISPFESYNVNRENPFVPWQQRQRETSAQAPKTTTGPRKVQPEVPKPTPLPTLAPAPARLPVAVGLLTAKGTTTVLTIPPDGGTPRWLNIGDTLVGWELTGVEEGNTTLWTELSSGQTLRQLISPSSEPTAEGEAAPKKSTKKSADSPGKDKDTAKNNDTAKNKKTAKDAEKSAKGPVPKDRTQAVDDSASIPAPKKPKRPTPPPGPEATPQE